MMMRRAPREYFASFLSVLLLWGGLSALLSGSAPGASTGEGDEVGPGFDSITEEEIQAHVKFLADPRMEGRDTPSEGQARAAVYLLEHYTKAKLEYPQDSQLVIKENGEGGPDVEATGGSFYRPFRRELEAPDERGCSLSVERKGERVEFKFGTDFVPIQRANGTAEAELVFVGFGIDSSKEKYNDFKSQRVKDRIVLLFEGEPRHQKKFDGEEVSHAASLYGKLASLKEQEVAGVLLVRRPASNEEENSDNLLDYRYGYATFLGENIRGPKRPAKVPPTLNISMDCASALLGLDAQKLAVGMDKAGRPKKLKLKDVKVTMGAATVRKPVRHDNLLGVLPGSDPELAKEYVLLGAHYDHIGVGPAGRVGCGANDNGSGCAAFLEVLEALAQSPPRRSILFANFCGEEIGLIGSRELAKDLPVPKEDIVCMVNLDMIGFGDEKEVAVLGVKRNPKLESVLERAKAVKKTGLKSVVTGKGEDLWQRSDHYSFHEVGLPVLFFFEGLPISADKDYHTWRDTPDKVNYPKVTNTARMVYNTVWILANDEQRPPAPRD